MVKRDFKVEEHQWDIALAALVTEEFKNKGAPLTTKDFNQLAHRYKIRFDDIMATVFELTIQHEWKYSNNPQQIITRKTLDDLYVNGRLKQEDIDTFTGEWRPDP
ncbi:MAG: hypothetical protein L3J70_08805 [Gammaproteobacteria bacterium]|nr:hypothetical protein [Gammaproteobacteria bacterium]